jgi:PmbA protein
MATSPFDDEGSPRQTHVVVSGGGVRGFLYDQYTATKEGRRSTGNAGRSGIKGPPVVKPTNFYVQKGKTGAPSLLSQVERGLFLTDLMGIHTADPISGDFSVGATGLWIENGTTTFPVKGVAIAGNLMILLANVTGVGDDLMFYGPFGSPTLQVSGISIAGSAP